MEDMQYATPATSGNSGTRKRDFLELEDEGEVSVPNPAKTIMVAATDNEEISASLATTMSCIIWNARGLGNPKAIHNLH